MNARSDIGALGGDVRLRQHAQIRHDQANKAEIAEIPYSNGKRSVEMAFQMVGGAWVDNDSGAKITNAFLDLGRDAVGVGIKWGDVTVEIPVFVLQEERTISWRGGPSRTAPVDIAAFVVEPQLRGAFYQGWKAAKKLTPEEATPYDSYIRAFLSWLQVAASRRNRSPSPPPPPVIASDRLEAAYSEFLLLAREGLWAKFTKNGEYLKSVSDFRMEFVSNFDELPRERLAP